MLSSNKLVEFLYAVVVPELTGLYLKPRLLRHIATVLARNDGRS